jgi:hypothetical protein
MRLKSLLKEAGLKSFRLDATDRAIAFPGRSREWLVVARLNADWLHLYTYICNIPRRTRSSLSSLRGDDARQRGDDPHKIRGRARPLP